MPRLRRTGHPIRRRLRAVRRRSRPRAAGSRRRRRCAGCSRGCGGRAAPSAEPLSAPPAGYSAGRAGRRTQRGPRARRLAARADQAAVAASRRRISWGDGEVTAGRHRPTDAADTAAHPRRYGGRMTTRPGGRPRPRPMRRRSVAPTERSGPRGRPGHRLRRRRRPGRPTMSFSPLAGSSFTSCFAHGRSSPALPSSPSGCCARPSAISSHGTTRWRSTCATCLPRLPSTTGSGPTASAATRSRG